MPRDRQHFEHGYGRRSLGRSHDAGVRGTVQVARRRRVRTPRVGVHAVVVVSEEGLGRETVAGIHGSRPRHARGRSDSNSTSRRHGSPEKKLRDVLPPLSWRHVSSPGSANESARCRKRHFHVIIVTCVDLAPPMGARAIAYVISESGNLRSGDGLVMAVRLTAVLSLVEQTTAHASCLRRGWRGFRFVLEKGNE